MFLSENVRDLLCCRLSDFIRTVTNNLLLSLVVICVWALDRVNQLFYICEENSVKKFNEFKNQGAFY